MFEWDEDAGIDLTPLIDVIFMLLIFFIMTTTFSKPVLDIALPVAETAKDGRSGVAELAVVIRADGTVLYEDRELDAAALTALLDTRRDDLLNLHVDEKAPFDAFVGVVDQVRKQRDGRFVISTRQQRS